MLWRLFDSQVLESLQRHNELDCTWCHQKRLHAWFDNLFQLFVRLFSESKSKRTKHYMFTDRKMEWIGRLYIIYLYNYYRVIIYYLVILIGLLLTGELHPCWSRLPRRPLNGRRDTGLIMTNSFYTNGSHVNFTCNPYFDLFGRDRLFCFGSEWEQDVPECRLANNICRIKPNKTMNNAYLKWWKRVEITNELDYDNKNETIVIYLTAEYTCLPGYTFKNADLTYIKKIDTKFFNVQNITCTGSNQWEGSPQCLSNAQT